MQAGKTIRVGILCDATGLQAWQVRCLEEISRLPFVKVVALVVNTTVDASARRSILQKALKNLRSGLLCWRLYERGVLARRSLAVQCEPIPAFAEAQELRCAPIKVGRFRQRLDDETVRALKDLDLDVVIRFGFGILTGDILNVAKQGLWSYHHGDPEKFRGAPPAFWEIHDRAPVSGVVLQKLTEALDGGLILRRGWFKTKQSNHVKSLDRLLFGAASFIAQALTELHCRGTLSPAVPEKLGSIYRYPKNGAMAVFIMRLVGAWTREQLRSLFEHQQWCIGQVPLGIEQILGQAKAGNSILQSVSWLAEQPGTFLADPFSVLGTETSDELRLLAEEFDWRRGIGQIVELAVPSPDRLPEPPLTQPAIGSKWHLSYPYVFESEGRLYCMPECAQSRSVRLYCRGAASNEWEEGPVIQNDFPAVDPTLFRHNGHFWLFCSSDEAGPNEMLFAWYADELLGPWSPHRLNPIKVDVRSARPAGRPFQSGGDLIRPAQDCSTGYGSGISFNRIVSLSPHDFREETIAILRPDPAGPYKSGLHTISAAGKSTIIDGARRIFVPAEMRRALGKKFGSRGAAP